MDYSDKTIKELKREEERLQDRYNDIMDECAKSGLPFSEFEKKSIDIKESLYFIAKYIKIKQDPTVEYGKEWRGDLITMEEFINNSKNDIFTDDDGFGYYATEDAKSDIEIIPSDILEGIYRKDFTHVIWFNK